MLCCDIFRYDNDHEYSKIDDTRTRDNKHWDCICDCIDYCVAVILILQTDVKSNSDCKDYDCES